MRETKADRLKQWNVIASAHYDKMKSLAYKMGEELRDFDEAKKKYADVIGKKKEEAK